MRCQPCTRRLLRTAFTLIELLVVIALIVVIAAIGILTIPLFQSQQKAGQNSSQIVAWLGDVKAQAIRQQRPTGLRFVSDPTDPNFFRELYYVQTPDDYTGNTSGGQLYQPTINPPPGTPPPPGPPPPLLFANVDFTGGLADVIDWPVQPGDYLEINGGGMLYQIVNVVNAQTLIVSRAAYVGAEAFDKRNKAFYTTQWRIIRQPRRVLGEDSLTLNGSVAIDRTLCQNLPTRVVPSNPPQTYNEIIFAPSGAVVGRGTVGSDRIILWVRDSSKTNVFDNDPVLIGIQVRTGFIGTYKVDMPPSADPYSFARDPRASGM